MSPRRLADVDSGEASGRSIDGWTRGRSVDGWDGDCDMGINQVADYLSYIEAEMSRYSEIQWHSSVSEWADLQVKRIQMTNGKRFECAFCPVLPEVS
jgi:hypothetical protein